ncbi:MAG TPA: hypothetical protein VF826_11035 [Chloroflexia bacterium]|jgi:4-amino-4-deoxy-L-arabinose transferase-like glycosyltransferase
MSKVSTIRNWEFVIRNSAAPAVLLVALALLPALVEFARHSWGVLWFPWQIDYDEGVNLNASWLLSRGVNIYRPNPPDHFVSALYPPLFYILNGAGIQLAGLNLWSGRLIALLGSLTAAGAIWLWVYSETRRHIPGLLSALLWLSLDIVLIWSTFYKQDVPSIGLALLGCAMLALWYSRAKSEFGNPKSEIPNPKSQILLYGSILPMSLAFWMKQSSVAQFAAAGLFLLLINRRLGVRWGLWAAASLIVPFLGFTALSKGGMLEHLLAFNAFGRSTDRMWQRLESLWLNFTPLVICGALFLVGTLAWAIRRKSVPPLSAFFLLVSIPTTILAVLHPTGNYNHLLNLLAPLCLVSGVIAGWASNRIAESGQQMRLAWLGAGALGGVILAVLAQAALTYNKPFYEWYTPLALPLEERAARMEQLEQVVRNTPGYILSEDQWLLLKNGKEVLYDDPVAMSALARAGEWDESVLLEDLRRRKYPLIILQYDVTGELYNPRWSDLGLATLQENYTRRFRDVYFTYAPAPPPAEPRTITGCVIEDSLTMQGFTFGITTANRGDNLPLSLYWREPDGVVARDPGLKVLVRLIDGSGLLRWQVDWQPGELAGKPWPSGGWGSETVRDDLWVPITGDLPYGRYRLQTGFYSLDPAGKVTPLTPTCSGDAGVDPDGTVILGDLMVVER